MHTCYLLYTEARLFDSICMGICIVIFFHLALLQTITSEVHKYSSAPQIKIERLFQEQFHFAMYLRLFQDFNNVDITNAETVSNEKDVF